MTKSQAERIHDNGAYPPDELQPGAIAPTMHFITTDELESLVLPDREWIVENVIPVGLVSGITAQSGVGKSWLALDLVRCISTGSVWAGRYQCKPMVCGYLDLEGDYIGLKTRWYQLNVGMGPLDAGHKPIHVLSDLGAINILNESTRNELTSEIRRLGIGVLFADTLSRTHTLKEEGAEMRLVMQAFDRVSRDAPCTIIPLHHAGWSESSRGRGSSAIRDGLQHEVVMIAEGGDQVQGAIRISLEKAKSSKLCPRLTTLTIRETPGGGVELDYSDAGAQRSNDKRHATIIALMDDKLEGLYYSELRDAIVTLAGCSGQTAERDIKKLAGQGEIVKSAEGKYYAKGLFTLM